MRQSYLIHATMHWGCLAVAPGDSTCLCEGPPYRLDTAL